MAGEDQIGAVRIGLASPEAIRARSSGEVTRAESFDSASGRLVEGGLFCERIFGPSTGGSCPAVQEGGHCWQRPSAPDQSVAACTICGERLTAARAWRERRERLGHVELAIPVPHPWFLADDESAIPLLLDLPRATIELVIVERQAWITHVDEERRARAVASIWDEVRRLREEDERARVAQLDGLASEDLGLIARLEAEHDELVALVHRSASIVDWIAEVERRLRPVVPDARFDRMIEALHRRRTELRDRLERAASERELARRLVRRLHASPLTDWYRERLDEPRRRVREVESWLRDESRFDGHAE